MNNSLENQDCPPLMSDGRFCTDNRPSCYVHDLIRKQNNINNNYDFKMLLTHNALKLQEINHNYYNIKNSCTSCNPYYLVDPNNHVSYWNKYAQNIGYRAKKI